MTDKWVVDADHPQGWAVAMTPAEEAQLATDQASMQAAAVVDQTAFANAMMIRGELQGAVTNALQLADALDANTATPAQQRQALSLCLHGLVRLAKVAYRTYDQPA